MKRPLVAVGLIACLVRVGLFALAPPMLQPLEPSVIAANLNAGRGFVFPQYGADYRAWKEPLYIVLLAALLRATSQPWAVALMQGAFGVAAAVAAAWIARRLYADDARAFIAGALVAINPFLLYYETHWIHPLSMDSALFLVVTGVNLWAIAERAGAGRAAVAAGLVLGASLWERASLLPSALGGWIAGVAGARPSQRRAMARAAIVAWALALAVIAPWLARNYVLFGRVILTTDAAHILWLGNNPWSNGTYSDAQGRRVIELADPAFRARITGASEIEQYDRFREAAGAFIREHPAQFARLIAARVRAFFWFSANAGVDYTGAQQRAYRLYYPVLLGLGVYGAARLWRRGDEQTRRRIGVLLGSVVGLAATHAMMAINLKHRVPFELVLSIFAAETLQRRLRADHAQDTGHGMSASAHATAGQRGRLVSVILPTYNEAENIVPLIHVLKRHLRGAHEILVMDDQSPDGTAAIAAAAFAGDPSVKVFARPGDHGLAKAIREGIERSTGEAVIVMNSDFNHNPALVEQLIAAWDRADIIIGSRFCKGGGMANPWRNACSYVFSCWFARPLLGTGVRDNLCGFYLMSRRKLLALLLEEIFYGYGDYFFRLLWHARARGYSTLEIPVFYQPRRGGKSKSRFPALLVSYSREVIKAAVKARRAPAADAAPRS